MIANKLHFADQIRAFVVRKKWGDSKDYVKCFDSLPWVISHPQVPTFNEDTRVRSFMCELFDPYSGKAHKLSDAVQMQLTHSINATRYGNASLDPHGYNVFLLGSKLGWVLFGGYMYMYSSLLNPFTNDIFLFRPKLHGENAQATFKGNPASSDCEIFSFAIEGGLFCMVNSDRISYRLKSSGRILDDGFLYSVLYLDENIYYLFHNGALKRTAVNEYKDWGLTSGFPEPYESSQNMRDCWLMEIKGDLIMVRMDVEEETNKWMIFKFDWCLKSWVVEASLNGFVIYISGKIAFASPLKNSQGDILEDCKLFYIEDGVFKCYSLSEVMGTEIRCEEFSRIIRPEQCVLSFIEPPYFGV